MQATRIFTWREHFGQPAFLALSWKENEELLNKDYVHRCNFSEGEDLHWYIILQNSLKPKTLLILNTECYQADPLDASDCPLSLLILHKIEKRKGKRNEKIKIIKKLLSRRTARNLIKKKKNWLLILSYINLESNRKIEWKATSVKYVNVNYFIRVKSCSILS